MGHNKISISGVKHTKPTTPVLFSCRYYSCVGILKEGEPLLICFPIVGVTLELLGT